MFQEVDLVVLSLAGIRIDLQDDWLVCPERTVENKDTSSLTNLKISSKWAVSLCQRCDFSQNVK